MTQNNEYKEILSFQHNLGPYFFSDEFRKASSLVKDGIDRAGEFMRNSSSPKRLSEDCVR